MIYKYYPPTSYTCDALSRGYFYFNKASVQNDPFEMSLKVLQSKSLLKALGYDEDKQDRASEIMKGYGCCCFTTKNNNKRMWASYADNYKGLAIGFDEEKFESYYQDYQARIHYVKADYIEHPITDNDLNSAFQLDLPLLKTDEGQRENPLLATYRYLDFIVGVRDERKIDVLFTHLCRIKENATWKIEDEYRLIAALDVINGQERLEKQGFEYLESGYKIPIPSDCVKEIIIGHNFDMKEIGWVKQIARKYGVKIIQQTKAEKPFEIELVDITENLNSPITKDAGINGCVEEEKNLDLEDSKLYDFIDFQQRFQYKVYRFIGGVVCLIAIASIGILQLTEWRPLGEAIRHKEINEIILNLSYSYLAAYIFYIVMNWLPSLKRRTIIKSYLKYHKSRIRELMTICINIQHPFSSLGREKKPYIGYKAQQSREEFLKEFYEKELTHLKLLESSRVQIKTLVDSALFFQEFLSEKELDNLLIIKNSPFLKESVRPIEYTDDEYRTEIPNNQRKMARSIYDIYELIKAIEK